MTKHQVRHIPSIVLSIYSPYRWTANISNLENFNMTSLIQKDVTFVHETATVTFNWYGDQIYGVKLFPDYAKTVSENPDFS